MPCVKSPLWGVTFSVEFARLYESRTRAFDQDFAGSLRCSNNNATWVSLRMLTWLSPQKQLNSWQFYFQNILICVEFIFGVGIDLNFSRCCRSAAAGAPTKIQIESMSLIWFKLDMHIWDLVDWSHSYTITLAPHFLSQTEGHMICARPGLRGLSEKLLVRSNLVTMQPKMVMLTQW